MTIPADTITTILTPLPRIHSVTNPSEGVSGQDRETDAELRVRRELSLALKGRAMVDSVYAGIASVSGVTSVKVYENKDPSPSPEGIPPHTIYCVVAGGQDLEIADAIMTNKSLGCGLAGDVTVNWTDIQGFEHPVRFARPVNINVHVKVFVDEDLSNELQDQLKAELLRYIDDIRGYAAECSSGGTLGIGDDVNAATLYPALTDEKNYNLKKITVGDSIDSQGDVLTIALDEFPLFKTEHIYIERY